MIEEIQKSIQLINFNDSIFDQKSGEKGRFDGEEVDVKRMLKGHCNGFVKWIQFEELMKSVINQQASEMGKVLVAYRPLLKINREAFGELIEQERKIQAEIEEQCFGQVFCNEKVKELIGYATKLFEYANVLDDFPVVLMKRIPSPFKEGNKLKTLATSFTLIEAKKYAQLNLEDFYRNDSNHCIFEFVELFNKFTNFLISEILKCKDGNARRNVVKKILKLAKEFACSGAMNSLKSCMAALESNSVHRLQVIKEQGTKYQKRFKMLSLLTSSESNFGQMRGAECLVPWLGILLRDFAFIKETHKNHREKFVNLPLGICLVKLVDSMTEAREVCVNFVGEAKGEDVKQAALMENWLRNCEIEFKDEESQYQRSKEISSTLFY